MTSSAPDAHDLLLLRFLIEDADIAPSTWDEWAGERDLDDHSAAAFELFPAVHTRLAELDIDHPWRARLKGAYRRAWVEQQLTDAAADAAFSSLDGSVDFLNSLASDLRRHGGDAALGRGMAPRLTVANSDAHRAYEALLDAGWNASSPPRLRTRIVTRLRRFQRGDHIVEVATTPLAGVRDPAYIAGVWGRSLAAEHGANRSLQDTVLQVLLHEPRNPKSIWWAFTVLMLSRRSAQPIDLFDCLPPTAEHRNVIEGRLRTLEQIVPTMSSNLPFPVVSRTSDSEQGGAAPAASLRDVAERWLGPRKIVTFSRLELQHRRGVR